MNDDRHLRPRRMIGTATAVAVASTIALGIAVGREQHSAAPLPEGVVRAENPFPVPWWGDGVLHLADVTLPVEEPGQVVPVGEGAAFTTSTGIVLVGADGRRSVIARLKNADVIPVAGSEDGRLLSWVDPGDESPQLVVYDVALEREVGRLDVLYDGPRRERLDEGPHPFAIEGGRVYYAGQDGDWTWKPGEAAPTRVTPADIDTIDVRAGRRLDHRWVDEQGWDEELRATSPSGAVQVVRGRLGRYSPAGDYLAVRTGPTYRVLRSDSMQEVPLHTERPLSGYDVDLTFASDRTVVVRMGGRPRPEPTEPIDGIVMPGFETWDLATCSLDTGRCTTLADASRQRPVIPE